MNAGLFALRSFARARRVLGERCDLCESALAAKHDHLWETRARALRCACGSCALVLGSSSGRYRRVEPRAEKLDRFSLSDADWERLRIPINVAFFVPAESGARAYFPSPAGATESFISAEDWRALGCDFAKEVEALLVNRLGAARDCYRVSIDECYRLVGIVRRHWRGLGGGAEVWEKVSQFFAELDHA